jgi:Pvc16 N-terminal domain
MSDYQVLDAVSKALRQILWNAINADAVVRPIVGSEAAIVFSNPTETARDSSNRLSLWLYQITENEYVKNQPMLKARVQPPPPPPGRAPRETAQYPPMALNLYFLATPFAQSDEANHLLLGKTMQVFYDNAIIFLEDTTSNIFEELRVIFCRLSLEELTRIWESLREPYRLSVCYLIRVTRLDSRRTPESGLVLERTAGFNNDPQAVAAP